ncbi:hypothetical protein BFV94_2063 [Alteromonas macleodii]|uniref:Uncharacterized protein n=1 Tax=Alteromonas macleodii TaxID=28108 RepID=A0AB36FRV5_ALTMA|nr:hypothetical protein BFV95_2063 [Alteromonas macleodii]OES32233.1 hypothetical protein BFV94_2063 [Alteromonas macleodii]OES32311.1 hypothetical protein BFV93_2055 [Alteromonas macleodii]OES41280.1 hypothetical protein BFV96_2049 [Alteromonas macleodii]
MFTVAFVLKVRLSEDTDNPTFIRLLPFCARSGSSQGIIETAEMYLQRT